MRYPVREDRFHLVKYANVHDWPTEEHMTGESAQELRRCLQQLSQGLGFWRPDLVDMLHDDLSPLRRAWGVNVNSPELARATIFANLFWHLKQIVPRSSRKDFIDESDQDRYRIAVQISFNLVKDKRIPDNLKTSRLQERRDWLYKNAPEELRISQSTSQRYFNDAVDQIVEQLTNGDYRPVIGANSEVCNLDATSAPAADRNEHADIDAALVHDSAQSSRG